MSFSRSSNLYGHEDRRSLRCCARPRSRAEPRNPIVIAMARDASIRRFPSPLRYPGGKGKISNFFKLLFLRNDLIGRPYIELYAGGASVALSLLYEEYASHVHINDLKRSVHAFWAAVLNDTDALCRRVLDTRVTTA